MEDTERREAETQAEGEAGSLQEPDVGLGPGPRITSCAKGRCQTAEPPRDPRLVDFYLFNLFNELQSLFFLIFKLGQILPVMAPLSWFVCHI